MHNENSGEEFTEEKGRKGLRPLDFETLPSLGGKCESSEGSKVVVRSGGEKNRSGPSDLEQIPISRRIGQEVHGV
jgi:hypothetical protein